MDDSEIKERRPLNERLALDLITRTYALEDELKIYCEDFRKGIRKMLLNEKLREIDYEKGK